MLKLEIDDSACVTWTLQKTVQWQFFPHIHAETDDSVCNWTQKYAFFLDLRAEEVYIFDSDSIHSLKASHSGAEFSCPH